LTATKILDPFFFATPLGVIVRTWRDFASGVIYHPLWITLVETLLAFIIGTVFGIVLGFWFARTPLISAVFEPYLKAANAIPRVVLAPIFALWLGLGIWSKVALGVTLTFFIVFFNVYQGVKEVSPVVLANARMLGANPRQLLWDVYLPSALSWVFSSLHTAVGFALVGAVVGEYLGSAAGLGYRIAQAEGVFDTVGVFSGMLILTMFVILIDAVVSLVEKRLLNWRPETATTQSAQG
jgi:NitT/TauT family transport system permease protein